MSGTTVIPFPPTGPTSITTTIPAYLYEEYFDDPDLTALIEAQNAIAQSYLDYLNALNLPIYTGPVVAQLLLDWVGIGLYGIPRPNMPSGTRPIGPYNTNAYNVLPYNQYRFIVGPLSGPVNDDIYRRVITWAFNKGDGKTFSTRWLKRRLYRFMNQVNGINANVDQTYSISVRWTGTSQETIAIANTGVVAELEYGIQKQILELPFQREFLFSIGGRVPQASYNNGGLLSLFAPGPYPTSDAGLPPGAAWSNGLVVSITPSVVSPNPAAPPVYFSIFAADILLLIGGKDLPTSDPGNPGQLWNFMGSVYISL